MNLPAHLIVGGKLDRLARLRREARSELAHLSMLMNGRH